MVQPLILREGIFKGGIEMLKEFKGVAMRGNIVDMAVGIIIGAAFGTIINSLVADVIMPRQRPSRTRQWK